MDLAGSPPILPVARPRRLAGLKARMAFILGVVLVPVLLYSCWQAVDAYRGRRAQQAETIGTMLRVIAGYEADFLARTRDLLTRLAYDPTILDGTRPSCSDRLREIASRNPDYEALAVFDDQGRPVCSTRSEPLAPAGDQRHLHALREGGDFLVSEVVPRAGGGSGGVITVGAPIRGHTAGAVDGMITIDINLQTFRRAIDGIHLPAGGVAYVVDAGGRLLTESVGGEGPVAAGHLAPDLFGRLRLNDGERVVEDSADGARREYLMTEVAGVNVYVVVGIPALPPLAWVQRDLVIGIFAPTLMLALAVVTIWIASDYLVNRHMRTLTVAARAYSHGDLDLRLDLASAPVEFQELARVLARMADRIQRREDELRASLQQKEHLLREVHHRVKNNLQIVTSLLNLRAQRLQSPRARDAVRQAQMRIGALAMVHRNLYETDDIQEIELKEFLAELCGMLDEVGAVDHAAVHVKVLAEPTRVLADQAIPMALLVTEAVSNALRHAFRPDRPGSIEVKLANRGQRAQLAIIDDGIGLAGSDDGSAGMGVTLMHMLAKQLGGSLSVVEAEGTRVELDFPLSGAAGTRAEVRPRADDPVAS